MNEHEPVRDDVSAPERTPGPSAIEAADGGGSAAGDRRHEMERPTTTVGASLRQFAGRRRPQLVAGVTVAVALAVIAGTLGSNRSASEGTHPTNPSTAARASAGSSMTAALPSAEPLTADAARPAASLVADRAVGSVVQLDSSFRLTSTDGTPASRLASRLTVSPKTDLTARTEAGDQAVTLTPNEPLTAGVVYRFALTGATGELLDTWAFQARQPLHIVSTLPDDQQSDVPVDTGIEVAFDQDGIGDVASHLAIDPPTPGHLETHDRTVAFVPDRPLAPRTVYSVTVTKGVIVSDTGERTESDTRFSFETTALGAPTQETGLTFQDEEVESATAERAVIGVWQFGDVDHPVKKTTLGVYRFAGMPAAIDAWRSLRARPDWTRYSTGGLVDASALSRVLSADVKVNGVGGSWWVSVPERLAAGWYLVQLDASRPVQTILQVTDVAGYVAVSETRTVVWANDLATGRAIAGATASADGASIGQTGKDGLLLATTPPSLLPQIGARCARPCDPAVVVTAPGGRAVFLPTHSSHDKLEQVDGGYMWSEADQHFWTLLDTDRDRYRSTDTVNVWGMVKSRTDGSVPPTVTLRFKATLDEPADVAIATIVARPSKSGVFIASIPLVEIPAGRYSIELAAAGRTVKTAGLEIGPIAKPAYELQVATGRRVYVSGDRIKVTVRASFYEGTPVPGVPLHIETLAAQRATTGRDGTAIARLTATTDPSDEGGTDRAVSVTPARTEEGEIQGSTANYVVYPGTRVVTGRAVIADGRVVVTGSVHALARDRIETAIGAGASRWDLDPNGAAISRAAVAVQFLELVPVRIDNGTTYDFIAKRIVPNYGFDLVAHDRRTVQVRTTARGTFRVALPNAVAGHDYRIVLTAADPDGHAWRATIDATADGSRDMNLDEASLQRSRAGVNDLHEYGVGDDIDVTMTGGDRSGTGVRSRYLFFVAHQGIRTAVVQSAARFVTPFGAWAPPNLQIGAIRFNGRAYVGDVGYAARMRTQDRRLDVRLTADAAGYRPGGTATVRVRTLDAGGSPVAATVVVRAVDEKLFSIGAAEADDPLGELYELVESGILGTFASHHGPRAEGGGGDTTGGGGDRGNFRDTLLFRTVTTGSDGRASVSFRLSDDLTAWRVSASAISGGLQAGTKSLLLPVGLPFFVDASIAPEYLVGDHPSISVRTYGSAVTAATPVTVTLSSGTPGSSHARVGTTAFTSVDIPLPALRVGVQTVTITATAGTGSSARTDRLTRTFRVVETRMTRSVQSLTTLGGDGPASLASGSLAGAAGLTSVVVSDAGAGAYLPLLEQLSDDSGARLEQALGADLANDLLVERFGFVAGDLEPSGYEADRYQSAETGGMAILPYAGADLEASVLAALVAPTRVDRQGLTSYLRTVHVDRDATREHRIMAAAGLAALGEPVLSELQRAATDPALTIRERLFVGIGLAAAGDSATARSVESALVTSAGERLGPVARLRVGADAADSRHGTALTAVLAAMTGDRYAPSFWAYVAATPGADRVESLSAVAYAKASLQRLATQPASFAITVDGNRRSVALDPGETYRLVLTERQVATLEIDRLAGTIAVVAGWRESASPTDFQPDPDVSIVRTAEPAVVDGSSLVRVNLTVTFAPTAAPGCHDVTELLPSGLTPVGSTGAWPDPGEDPRPSAYTAPYDESADRVRFCADPQSPGGRDLRYYARAITTGTYVWEPAVVESATQAGHASLTDQASLTIR